ncbi:MAG: hypothetical protein ACYCSS_06950 [Sulfuriferula sp.]
MQRRVACEFHLIFNFPSYKFYWKRINFPHNKICDVLFVTDELTIKVAYIESSLGSDGSISGTSYDPDGSYRIVTDDGRGSIAMNDYAPDGTPVNNAGIIGDGNSSYDPDGNYAQDSGASQASNDNTNWNA